MGEYSKSGSSNSFYGTVQSWNLWTEIF